MYDLSNLIILAASCNPCYFWTCRFKCIFMFETYVMWLKVKDKKEITIHHTHKTSLLIGVFIWNNKYGATLIKYICGLGSSAAIKIIFGHCQIMKNGVLIDLCSMVWNECGHIFVSTFFATGRKGSSLSFHLDSCKYMSPWFRRFFDYYDNRANNKWM